MITNPLASRLTERQHSRLAAHYLRRHRVMAALGRGMTRQQAIDYATLFQKYLYHNRQAMTLRKAAQEARTEAGLITLNQICTSEK